MLTIHRKSIRTMRITVAPTGEVSVSVPNRVSEKHVQDFIESKQLRIHKIQAQFQQKQQEAREQFPLQDDELLLHGVAYRYRQDMAAKQPVIVDHQARTIVSKHDLGDPQTQKVRYKTYAKEFLSLKLEKIATKFNLQYTKIIIRDQKTKWGTCSTKRNIGLNWKLVKMPDEIAEYVICHELAHLTHMNHSKHFRTLVEKMYPTYKDAEQWMKKYGMSLQ